KQVRLIIDTAECHNGLDHTALDSECFLNTAVESPIFS
ncbi:MAG: hypothetical protein ACI909_002501, partial [Planctomycetota bacterium]